MEINVPGITNLNVPIDAQAKGEAGLGHWRRALNGYCVDSTLDAVRICGKVLEANEPPRSIRRWPDPALRTAPSVDPSP